MKQRGMLAAIAVIVISNAFALAHLEANRRGEPKFSIELTERELKLHRPSDDSSLRSLTLEWQSFQVSETAKVAALGFPTDIKLYHEWRSKEKLAYVALEYDGPAWQAYRQELLKEKTADRYRYLEQAKVQCQSRLCAIDADVSYEALRARHAGQAALIIIPAKAEASTNRYKREGKEGLKVIVEFRRSPVEDVYVPKKFDAAFEGISADTFNPWGVETQAQLDALHPRYAVKLAFGQSLEPWIVEAKKL